MELYLGGIDSYAYKPSIFLENKVCGGTAIPTLYRAIGTCATYVAYVYSYAARIQESCGRLRSRCILPHVQRHPRRSPYAHINPPQLPIPSRHWTTGEQYRQDYAKRIYLQAERD